LGSKQATQGVQKRNTSSTIIYLFIVMFHKDLESDSARIVGFEVIPNSVKHEYEQPWDNEKPHLTSCDPNTKRTVSNSETPQEVVEDKEIIFTYDVTFRESPVKMGISLGYLPSYDR